MPGLGELIVIVLVLTTTGIWLWMLLDCIRHEAESDKLVWLLVIILGGVIGALIYLFARRGRRGRTTS